jgi:iron(III) transport system substrate-binding protein
MIWRGRVLAVKLQQAVRRSDNGAERQREETSMRMRFAQGLALVATLVIAGAAAAQAPAPTKLTPELIEAARKEGKVVWYTSVELELAERVAKAFEAKYPGIPVQVERSGAERNFQRLAQEYASNIHSADFVNSSDAAHFIVWKRQGWLAPFVPEEVANYYPPEQKDPDGTYATWRMTLSIMGYNTKLVKPDQAPKSFADLLDPKWAGKMVKAHPGYSGTILTSTFEMARDLGWDYFKKLSKQRVMQVQSATDPPRKLAAGERSVMIDGSEYVLLAAKEKGSPVEPIYPTEGAPQIVGPSAVLKDAPHPNAARLFAIYSFSTECQQLIVDVGALRSADSQVKERPGRPALKDIKVMKDDPKTVESQVDEIKKKYLEYFGT